MLTFSNNVEPANGFLVRYLRRKLVESDCDVNANREELLRVLDWVPKLWYHLHTFLEKHSTSDFLIGMARPATASCATPGGRGRGHSLSFSRLQRRVTDPVPESLRKRPQRSPHPESAVRELTPRPHFPTITGKKGGRDFGGV